MWLLEVQAVTSWYRYGISVPLPTQWLRPPISDLRHMRPSLSLGADGRTSEWGEDLHRNFMGPGGVMTLLGGVMLVSGIIGVILTGGTSPSEPISLARQLSWLGVLFGMSTVLMGFAIAINDPLPNSTLIGLAMAVVANVLFAFLYPERWALSIQLNGSIGVGILWVIGHALIIAGGGTPYRMTPWFGRKKAQTSDESPSFVDERASSTNAEPSDNGPVFESELFDVHYDTLGILIRRAETIHQELEDSPDVGASVDWDAFIDRVEAINRDRRLLQSQPTLIRQRYGVLIDCLDSLLERCPTEAESERLRKQRNRLAEPTQSNDRSSANRSPRSNAAHSTEPPHRSRPDPSHQIRSSSSNSWAIGDFPLKFALLMMAVGIIILIAIFIEIGA